MDDGIRDIKLMKYSSTIVATGIRLVLAEITASHASSRHTQKLTSQNGKVCKQASSSHFWNE